MSEIDLRSVFIAMVAMFVARLSHSDIAIEGVARSRLSKSLLLVFFFSGTSGRILLAKFSSVLENGSSKAVVNTLNEVCIIAIPT